MSTYRVRMQVELTVDEAEGFDAALRGLLEELGELVQGADSVATGEPNVVDVYATVEAYSPSDAVLAGTSSLRAAMHAVGTPTTDWPQAYEWHLWMEERAVEANVIDAGDIAARPVLRRPNRDAATGSGQVAPVTA